MWHAVVCFLKPQSCCAQGISDDFEALRRTNLPSLLQVALEKQHECYLKQLQKEGFKPPHISTSLDACMAMLCKEALPSVTPFELCVAAFQASGALSAVQDRDAGTSLWLIGSILSSLCRLVQVSFVAIVVLLAQASLGSKLLDRFKLPSRIAICCQDKRVTRPQQMSRHT